MKKYTAIGLMSGTSMDGIDVALVSSDGKRHVERGPNLFLPYDDKMRSRIEQGLQDAKAISHRAQRPGLLDELEEDITIKHAEAVGQYLDKYKISKKNIDMVGFHGQTVLHRPQDALTLQLGDGRVLANATGLEVVCDLRANDMAHGGQGAPLVPAYHRALVNSLPDSLTNDPAVVFVNIGGISNVTYVGANGDMIAFDCGPGNALIDQWVHAHTEMAFDDGGKLALSGKLISSISDRYLSHPYFDLSAPKTLDRLDFEPLANNTVSLEDGARSLAHVTAASIVRSVEHFPVQPGNWIICGGGVRNIVIMNDLRALLAPSGAEVMTADDAGFSSMAMEAEAFAYLAIRSKLGLDLTWPGTTGCATPVTGGVLFTPHTGSTIVHA